MTLDTIFWQRTSALEVNRALVTLNEIDGSVKYSRTAAKLGFFLPEKYNKGDEAPPAKSITSTFAYVKVALDGP